jgi:hypothetical protein
MRTVEVQRQVADRRLYPLLRRVAVLRVPLRAAATTARRSMRREGVVQARQGGLR